ncbi:CotS family spore coat protein [Bacillus sp. 31A1R]|uniref:CotS family spore coat protein n=1 Tax=Robertmurraya mangrovi TaxID=3098077 RepID=A0ABU5J2W3_9BACI|nr:CotS family spore coat protein [Bacillus sp. 31A1R]MDZ5473692.1 CotS family spore coat protein [Bacillus sp. 31A1R]
MDDKLIEPWGIDLTLHDELYVPEYITELAYEVVKSYDFAVRDMQVMATKPFKGGAIWKLETTKGPKSLKLLHRRPSRSLFSLAAQEYLVEVKKARVPSIVQSKSGSNFVERGGKLWFVAEWIVPLEPVNDNLEGAKLLCHALGEFHYLTSGYKPPKQAEISSRLYKWPKNYQKVIEKLDWFRQILTLYTELPASNIIMSHLDFYEKQAKNSLERLNNSPYSELVKKGNVYWGLAHQDYGWSNAQMGPNGMWVIDLDGVSYDLPIRDLSKLITGAMSGLAQWDSTWVREMIQSYHEARPIPPELYEVLMIDLSLPNEFYKNIKHMIYDPELFLDEDLKSIVESIVQLEDSKWKVLKEIEQDWKGEK